MKLSDFQFELPDELIARFPTEERTASRLMVLQGDSGAVSHRQFTDLLDYLKPEDLLVFNDTRVLPARLWGQKASGGRVEILVERVLDQRRIVAHMRASKAAKAGTEIFLSASQGSEPLARSLTVTGRDAALFTLQAAEGDSVLEIMQQLGHMPLPPYIDRDDQQLDRERYQTVYARRDGAVAAPTAGLHFSQAFIGECIDKGIETAHVTLHVGAGTFQPVRVDDIRDHSMHKEYIEVSAKVCQQVADCRARGGRVIAVGTTAVRSLESASAGGELRPYAADSDIFIYPGYRFNNVDAMITNFHLSESTLLMLVSAFAGREHILQAYRQAVAERYRFFSYGDAMLIFPQPAALTASA